MTRKQTEEQNRKVKTQRPVTQFDSISPTFERQSVWWKETLLLESRYNKILIN